MGGSSVAWKSLRVAAAHWWQSVSLCASFVCWINCSRWCSSLDLFPTFGRCWAILFGGECVFRRGSSLCKLGTGLLLYWDEICARLLPAAPLVYMSVPRASSRPLASVRARVFSCVVRFGQIGSQSEFRCDFPLSGW